MAEQGQELEAVVEETTPSEISEMPREISETEKKLRREVARYREQVRIAQSERDAACANAARERDDAVAAAQTDARQRVLQAELKSHAIRCGILDLDALKLADVNGVSFDEAGNTQGVEEVVSRLQAQKPYLFASENSAASGTTTTQTMRPPQPVRPVAVDARNLSREAWHAERERLLAAHRG
ncbi:hypothetical protein NFI95_04900 [Acetobacteraceae bacterium KSS8]|uniref:DUF4355 domain-containing protein n=1 Tax=Endosaccharibacter trunci TaxID=2812733 RepID=A0ABT1W4H0_9PROT|nr:hypothetical protein [Acetobacteraceae bacterium KSS8]